MNTFNIDKGIRLSSYASRCIENEILMYFRSNKKNDSNISLDDKIGFDKEGNEITILDVLKTPMPMFDEVLETKDNIKLLRKYFNTLTEREKEKFSIWIRACFMHCRIAWC